MQQRITDSIWSGTVQAAMLSMAEFTKQLFPAIHKYNFEPSHTAQKGSSSITCRMRNYWQYQHSCLVLRTGQCQVAPHETAWCYRTSLHTKWWNLPSFPSGSVMQTRIGQILEAVGYSTIQWIVSSPTRPACVNKGGEMSAHANIYIARSSC